MAHQIDHMEKSHLELLPQELILDIMSKLPPESKACLARTSRAMVRKSGIHNWLGMNKEREWRQMQKWLGREEEFPRDSAYWRYLQLLQHDKPSTYACAKCLKLHRIGGRDHASPQVIFFDLSYDFANRFHDPCLWLSVELKYGLASHHIQEAMARHRCGGLRKGLFDLIHYAKDRTQDQGLESSSTRVFDVEARISGGHFLIRTQKVLKLDFTSPKSSRQAVKVLTDSLCRHWQLPQQAYRGALHRGGAYGQLQKRQRLAMCRNIHEASTFKGCEYCNFAPRCADCPTETSLLKIDVRPGWFVVVVTQWKDLGATLAPDDPVWQAHSASKLGFVEGLAELRHHKWLEPALGLRDIRKRFEEQPGRIVGNLTAANLRKMWASEIESRTAEIASL